MTSAAADRERWPQSALEPLGLAAFKMANSILKDAHAAQDIAQAVLASLVASPNPPPDPQGWVTRGAKWAALNELRRRRREVRRVLRLLQHATRPSEDFTNQVAARLLLNDILASLPFQDRMVLELQYLARYPQATVADFMRISEEALKKRTQRALEKARRVCEQMTIEEREQ